MSNLKEHEAEQAALCQQYEGLSRICQMAIQHGMHIDDVNEKTALEYLADANLSGWDLHYYDEARATQNEDIAEAHDECRAALGQLLDQVYQMQGMFPDDAELELAIQDAEQALEEPST